MSTDLAAKAIFDREWFDQLSGVTRSFNKEWDEQKHKRNSKGDEHGGEFTSTGGSSGGSDSEESSVSFVAPSIDDSSGSIDRDTTVAIRKLDSERHANQKRIMEDVDANLGIKSKHINAVGVWSDGAENSLAIESKGVDHETLKYATAIKAQIARQKDAIAFTPNEDGKALMYTVSVENKNMRELRKIATDSGLEYHTIVEDGKGGSKILVFDPSGSGDLDDVVSKFSDKVDSYEAKRIKGDGGFLTNEYNSRSKASAKYDEIIDEYEKANPTGRRYSGSAGDEYRHNRGGSVAETSDEVKAIQAEFVSEDRGMHATPGYHPDVNSDDDGDGVTDHARVGVPALHTPPPPAIGRIPNLTHRERQVEDAFVKAFEEKPDELSDQYSKVVMAITPAGEPPVFNTDDAKGLTSAWSHEDPAVRAVNRATLTTPLHSTANAIAKKAFVEHLDTLDEGDEILVTVGGVGAGKGFALKKVPQAQEMKKTASVVWDSAGDQNATENPWIQKEAEKRGLKVNYVYVHADPEVQWADPERGVLKRAANPADGRMVDAHVFADSYALGAKNHKAFYEKNKDNPNANFVFLDNTGPPKLVDGIPESALKINRNALYAYAVDKVTKSDAPPHVKRGALMGSRIWGT